MKIYLAAVHTSSFDINSNAFRRLSEQEKQHRLNVQHILESYHYVRKDSMVRRVRREGKKVFLDSGAFSDFAIGTKTDINAYCAYIKKNEDIIEYASVLDSIGSAQGTYVNQCKMEKQGVRPLPCFHYGEDERYLKYYLDNYDYITLGGMVPISTPQLKFWLDRIWDQYLTDDCGHPKVKVHGFGLTTISLMERYPWYSVDSSSWQQLGSNGSILIPGYCTLAISNNSPSRKKKNAHYTTMPEEHQAVLKAKIESLGFDVERLKDSYLSRWAFNCWAFTEINRTVQEKENAFKVDQIGLF